MTRKIMLTATVLLLVSISGSLLLSKGFEEEDLFEMVEIAKFEIGDSPVPKIIGDNLYLLSEDKEEIENRIVIYQPKVWYNKSMVSGRNMTDIGFNNNQLILDNRQNIRVVNYRIHSHLLESIYNKKKSNIDYDIKISTIMPYIIEY